VDANEYQELALRTAGDQDGIMPNGRAIYSAFGLSGESGEVADIHKKWLFHGHPYDRDELLKELGDVQWYLAVNASSHGITLAELMEHNIAKLKKRYPEGFSTERSINREV
jgi:NTP pyrophosphatase (non-canonical NTP hydrolase)